MLRAENLSGLSGNSNVASVTLPVILPGAPSNVRAYPTSPANSVRTVTVAWNATSNATGYSIEAKPCRGGEWRTVALFLTRAEGVVDYTTGCWNYRVVADRYGRYGPKSGSVIAFGPVNDYPWSGFGLDPYLFFKNECTSFVASRVDKYYRPKPPYFSGPTYLDAKHWDTATATFGGIITHTPVAGAIGQRNGGDNGHVAWVSGVDGDYVFVEEYNANGSQAYGRRWVNRSYFDNYLVVN
jgi:hypothetical protein